MRKILLLLTSLFMLAASAQDPVVSITTVVENQKSKIGDYIKTWQLGVPNDPNSWTVENFNNNQNSTSWNDMRCGRKGNISVARITTNFAIPAAIDKVSVKMIPYMKTADKDKLKSLKLQVCENLEFADGSYTEYTASYTNPADAATVIDVDIPVSAPKANCYYRLVFDCASAANNGFCAVKSVSYYGVAEAGSVAVPVIALGDNNMVSITQADGADIYYTVDESVPTSASTKYTAPFAITGVTTVKAIAVLNGKDSPVTTKVIKPNTVSDIAAFLQMASTDITKINTPVTAIYKNGSYMWIKDNAGSYLLAYGTISGVTSVTNGDVYSFISGTYKDQYGVPEILPTAIGEKSAGTPVDPIEVESFEDLGTDMVNQYIRIEGVNIVAATAPNYTATDANGTTCTLRNVFTNATYNDVLEVPEGDGFTVYGFVSLYKTASSTTIQINPIKFEGGQVMETVATPVFTPEDGSELKAGDVITIECATEGASIYFTTENETPTADSQKYTGPISFTEPVTIKAIAIKDGMLDSDVATATYTLYVEGSHKAMIDFREGGNALEIADNKEIAINNEVSTNGGVNDINGVNFTNGPVQFSISKGEGSDDPKWWGEKNGNDVRCYKNNVITLKLVENGYKITEVEFLQVSGSTSWASTITCVPADGTWSNKTWKAPATSLVNEFTMTLGGATRIACVNVTYVEDNNGSAGVDDVVVDNSDAPVEYYNLQGIRVNADNLTPGIYVRRQGTEVTKILVK